MLIMQMIKNNTVVDLFCGCGGLSLGFMNTGYEIILGIDHDPNALETFRKNHTNSQALCSDITLLTKTERLFENVGIPRESRQGIIK
jgi:DNA (cytosine-5)-methyltransferase 1